MNTDAQEAAMGLLSLSPSNVAMVRAGPVVPLKRKLSTGMKKRPTTSRGRLVEDVSQETIRCICGSTFDDGFSIACDECSRWCHAACFEIDPGHVPEEWRCWVCVARGKRRRVSVDEVPSAQTRTQLARAAQEWRGVSALTPYSPQTTLHAVPPASPAAPPGFALHTTAALAKEALITPLTSTITPSAAYVADPLNAYAHLGLPKPFVHLLGPPLDVALDARMAADDSRWVRSGCRPNAVLRPVLCRAADQPSTLGFAVFATRDLRKGEEVVLGWEWDDGHAIHLLPALLKAPGLFPPAHKAHLRAQMANILHLLTSTFPACACGAHASNCALRAMERFVTGADHPDPDLGPLVGRTRGFRSRERVPGSGGLGGVEIWPCDDPSPERTEDNMPPKMRKRWIHKAGEALKREPGRPDDDVQQRVDNHSGPPPHPAPAAPPTDESPSVPFARLSIMSPIVPGHDDTSTSGFGVIGSHGGGAGFLRAMGILAGDDDACEDMDRRLSSSAPDASESPLYPNSAISESHTLPPPPDTPESPTGSPSPPPQPLHLVPPPDSAESPPFSSASVESHSPTPPPLPLPPLEPSLPPPDSAQSPSPASTNSPSPAPDRDEPPGRPPDAAESESETEPPLAVAPRSRSHSPLVPPPSALEPPVTPTPTPTPPPPPPPPPLPSLVLGGDQNEKEELLGTPLHVDVDGDVRESEVPLHELEPEREQAVIARDPTPPPPPTPTLPPVQPPKVKLSLQEYKLRKQREKEEREVKEREEREREVKEREEKEKVVEMQEPTRAVTPVAVVKDEDVEMQDVRPLSTLDVLSHLPVLESEPTPTPPPPPKHDQQAPPRPVLLLPVEVPPTKPVPAPVHPIVEPPLPLQHITFQAKAELIEHTIPPAPTATKAAAHHHHHHHHHHHGRPKANGHASTTPRPLFERIGPLASLHVPSPPRAHDNSSSQEDGEISLGDETPSPQPAPRRTAPPFPPIPPIGPMRSAPPQPQPHRNANANAASLPPLPPRGPKALRMSGNGTSRAPPTGPRVLRLAGARQLAQASPPPQAPPPQPSAYGRQFPSNPDRDRDRMMMKGRGDSVVPEDGPAGGRRGRGPPPRGPSSTDLDRDDRDRDRDVGRSTRGDGGRWGR